MRRSLIFSVVLSVALAVPAWADLAESADVGGPAVSGSIVQNGSDYTIIGGGKDIWGSSDQFFYAWETHAVVGDFTATVMVESMVSADPNAGLSLNGWAKAGIMARDGSAANAMHVSAFRSLTNGAALQYRTGTGSSSGTGPLPGSYGTGDAIWLKLDRMNDWFFASWAPDNGGTPGAWQTGPTYVVSPSIPASLHLGLATTSHTDNDTQANSVEVVYKDWSVGPLSAPPVPDPWQPPAGAPTGGMGTMGVREVYNNGGISDQSGAQNSLLNPGVDANVVDYTAPVLNIWDSDGHGRFSDEESSFGVVGEGVTSRGNVNNISVVAQGTIRITEAGTYTVGVNSDDGFTLFFPGQQFTSLTNCQSVLTTNGIGMQYFGGRAAGDSLGVIDLPAGDHPFWLTYHEGTGGAAVELFAAAGAKGGFDDDFELVGHVRDDRARLGMQGAFNVETTTPGQFTISNLASAVTALDTAATVTTDTAINYNDPNFGGPGSFGDDVPFPLNQPDADDNHYAIRATGTLEVLFSDWYHMGFQGDDGGSLKIAGQTWDSLVENVTGSSVIDGDTIKCDIGTGNSRTIGRIWLDEGLYDLELVFMEMTGGSYVELFGGAEGYGYELLMSDVAELFTDADGLPLVPEPTTMGLLALGGLGLLLRRRRR